MHRIRSWESLLLGAMGFGLFLFTSLALVLIGRDTQTHPVVTKGPAVTAPAPTACSAQPRQTADDRCSG